jgi:serine/threonine protein kinase
MSNHELAVRLVLLALGSQSADGYAETNQDPTITAVDTRVVADALASLQDNSIVVASYRKEAGFAYQLGSAIRLESRLIDWVCQAFEMAWKDGGTNAAPRIEHFVETTAGQMRACLLQELVKIDVEYRQDAGDSPTKEEYFDRFPAETNAVEAAWQHELAGQVDSSRKLSLPGVPSLEEVSNRLPHLKNLTLVGQGGMGVVYRAHDHSGRLVAVKVLPPELNKDEEFVRRFEHEAELLKNLDHPRIVKIHYFERYQDLCYFTMEFAIRGNLRKKINKDVGIPHKEAIDIILQICEGLRFAHERAVIHRDIKPENILLDAEGGVKIADFGLAKLVSSRQSSFRTKTGQVMGTLEYMAPEQRQGVGDIDRRADIYSIGVLLYELLTGRLPMGVFDPPSRMGDHPKWLDEIISCSLRDKRKDRFDNVDEMISSIRERRVVRRHIGSSASSPDFPEAYESHLKDGPNPRLLSVFLKSYSEVVARALGGWFINPAIVAAKSPFDFEPGGLGGFTPDLSLGLMVDKPRHFEWRHLLFCAAYGRLFDQELPNDDLRWAIERIRKFSEWRKSPGDGDHHELRSKAIDASPKGKTFSHRDNHVCIILAGRREQLLGEDVECIAALRAEDIVIWSYDWLLNAWDKIRP